MNKPEMYMSIDIETDGPCPGQNSMLSIGIAAFEKSIDVQPPLEKFYRKLEPLPDGMRDSDTMLWWAGQPEGWAEVNKAQESPMEVMNDCADWLLEIKEDYDVRLVPAAWPAAFDFGFVNWYMHSYYGANPLGFSCLDIRSFANGLFNTAGYYEKISEGDLYNFFQIDTKQFADHIAIDDATKQGMLLIGLLKEADFRYRHGVNSRDIKK
jgi:hypothetical protein